jgi:hypothetical protein
VTEAPADPALGPPAEAGGDWRARAHAIYGLAEGQVIKRVPPPFPPERDRLLREHNMPNPDHPTSATWVWDGTRLKWNSLSLTAGTVAGAIQMGARLNGHELDQWEGLGDLPGDLVIREGTTKQQRLDALAELVERETGRKIRFEPAKVQRDTIVVRGEYRPGPLEGLPGNVIELFAGDGPDPRQRQAERGDLKGLFSIVENLTSLRVDDETAAKANPRVSYRIDRREPLKPDRIIELLGKQTGLRFAVEKRETEMWRVVK